MDQQFEILLITRKNLLNSMKDLSIGELTKIPNGFNNNIIWNAAHNLATQQLLVYKLSGQSPIIPGELIEKYRKGTSAPKNVSENEINEIKGLMKRKDRVDNAGEDFRHAVGRRVPHQPVVRKRLQFVSRS